MYGVLGFRFCSEMAALVVPSLARVRLALPLMLGTLASAGAEANATGAPLVVNDVSDALTRSAHNSLGLGAAWSCTTTATASARSTRSTVTNERAWPASSVVNEGQTSLVALTPPSATC